VLELLSLDFDGSGVVDFAADLLSLDESEEESVTALLLFRLSVAYQPLPLKTTAGALRMRFAVPLPHSSQACVVSASNPCLSSYVDLQAGQWYS